MAGNVEGKSRPCLCQTANCRKNIRILPLSVVVADRGYDNEDNHTCVRESLHAFSIIPSRYVHVPIWRTHGKYRKEMKRGYSKILYNQRNKEETIMSGKSVSLVNTLHQG